MYELYSVKRKDIQTGDLLAWKKTKINSIFDFFLLLYQKICGAEYIHVALAMRIGDRLFAVEATPPIVRVIPLSLLDDFYLFSTNVTPNESHIPFLLKNIGKPYNLFDFIANLLNLGNREESYYCSEECAEFYSGIGYIEDEDPGKTPDSLVKAVTSSGKCSAPVLVKIDRGNLSNGV